MEAGRTARGLKGDIKTPEQDTNTEKRKAKKGKRLISFKLFSIGAGVDMPLFFLIIILLSIGLVMLFSASYASSYYYNNGDSYAFIRPQAFFAISGFIIMMAISFFDYHRLHMFAWPLYIFTVLCLLVVVLFKGTALVPKGGGAYRWINLGFTQFQPSEVAKFAVILLFAHLVSQKQKEMGTFKKGFLPFMGLLGLICGLIIIQPHLSGTIIIVGIGVVMMFIGGTKSRYLIGTVALGVVLVFIAYLSSESIRESFAYVPGRIQCWLNPFNPPEGYTIRDDTWQTVQSLYAIGSGELLGVGLGQSRQKYLYLPEPQNDFIFAVVCEELGFIGALIIIIIFGAFIWRCVYVAIHAKDRFGTMLGLGIAFQVGIQIVLNLCVVTNTIPNTGISLPFFSSGGTALWILLAEMGVLLQISRSSNIEKT